MNWAEEEFKTMEFGDARLDRRAGLLAEQLSQRLRSHPAVLGPLSDDPQRGLSLHPTSAAPPGREPLGRINSWNWAREFKPEGDGARPGMLESGHWLEGY